LFFREDYLHALDLDPAHLPARVNLAFVLQAEGKFKEAWEELTSALKRNKNYVPALEARAIICLQMGNLFEAFTDLNTAIDVSQVGADLSQLSKSVEAVLTLACGD
jgi:Flp pilus assembly protein TadD